MVDRHDGGDIAVTRLTTITGGVRRKLRAASAVARRPAAGIGLAVWLAAWWVGGAAQETGAQGAVAQETGEAARADAADAQAPQDAAPEDGSGAVNGADETADAQAPPATAPDDGAAAQAADPPSLGEIFIPSQDIRADEAVIFPVDF